MGKKIITVLHSESLLQRSYATINSCFRSNPEICMIENLQYSAWTCRVKSGLFGQTAKFG